MCRSKNKAFMPSLSVRYCIIFDPLADFKAVKPNGALRDFFCGVFFVLCHKIQRFTLDSEKRFKGEEAARNCIFNK